MSYEIYTSLDLIPFLLRKTYNSIKLNWPIIGLDDNRIDICIGWIDKWMQNNGPDKQVRQDAILDVMLKG